MSRFSRTSNSNASVVSTTKPSSNAVSSDTSSFVKPSVKPRSFASSMRAVSGEREQEQPVLEDDNNTQDGFSDYNFVPVTSSERNQAKPITQEIFSRQASAQPPKEASQAVSLAARWGFAEDMVPPSQWETMDCPKCIKSTQKKSSIQMNADGLFFCSVCGFHGNITLSTRDYRENWLSVWRKFVTDPTRQTTPPDFLPPETKGSWVSVWENDTWSPERWHTWCFMKDRSGISTLNDAYIYNESLLTWSRPEFSIPSPFGMDVFAGERIVFINHLEDLLPLQEAGVKNIVCLPPDLNSVLTTAPAWKVLETIEKQMGDVKEIVLALHATPADRALEEELGRRLDRERCFRVRWRPDDDEVVQEEIGPLDAATKFGYGELGFMVEVAPPFPVVGVYELQDLEDKFDELYHTGLVPGASTGWPSLDQYYTVKTGQWTVVTGIPGHGKSSLLDGLLVNLASNHGWRFGLFSPENQPVERHFASLMEKKLKKPFSDGPVPRITETEKNKTKRWLNDRFKVILPDEEKGVWTLDAVLDLARTLVYRYGIRGLVIDPWNELDHSRASNINETSQISESLTKVRRFARLYDVHVWIVAHPTKLEKKSNGKYPVATPYDISGGAHWRNKADNALSIYRNVDEEDSDVCDIYVQKIRFKEVGRVGWTSIRSEKASGSYVDDIDHNKRQVALSKGEYIASSLTRVSERVYKPQIEKIEYDHDF